MAKHIQKNRRQQPMNCLSVFDHFMELTLKGLGKRLPPLLDIIISLHFLFVNINLAVLTLKGLVSTEIQRSYILCLKKYDQLVDTGC